MSTASIGLDRLLIFVFSSYLGMYCFLVFVVVASNVYSTLVYTYGTLRASRVIHNKLVNSMLGSTFRYEISYLRVHSF